MWFIQIGQLVHPECHNLIIFGPSSVQISFTVDLDFYYVFSAGNQKYAVRKNKASPAVVALAVDRDMPLKYPKTPALGSPVYRCS